MKITCISFHFPCDFTTEELVETDVNETVLPVHKGKQIAEIWRNQFKSHQKNMPDKHQLFILLFNKCIYYLGSGPAFTQILRVLYMPIFSRILY